MRPGLVAHITKRRLDSEVVKITYNNQRTKSLNDVYCHHLAFKCHTYTHTVLNYPPYCRIYATVNHVSIGSDNGLSPIRRQAIIWISSDLLSIRPSGTNFSEMITKIQKFSFTKMHMKISSAKRWPFVQGWGLGWGWRWVKLCHTWLEIIPAEPFIQPEHSCGCQFLRAWVTVTDRLSIFNWDVYMRTGYVLFRLELICNILGVV